MVGLTDLEAYNSIFIITEENNKFELYTDTFEFTELKDDLEEIHKNSNVTSKHLQDEIIEPRITST